MELTPFQKPHPPLWYGVVNPDSAMRAAKAGMSFISNAPAAAVRAKIERYIATERPSGCAAPKFGMNRYMVIADTDAEALSLARRAYRVWYASFMHLWWKYNQKPPNVNYPPEIDGQIATGTAVVGSPETVLKALRPQLEELGQQLPGVPFCVRRSVAGGIAALARPVHPARRAGAEGEHARRGGIIRSPPRGRFLLDETAPIQHSPSNIYASRGHAMTFFRSAAIACGDDPRASVRRRAGHARAARRLHARRHVAVRRVHSERRQDYRLHEEQDQAALAGLPRALRPADRARQDAGRAGNGRLGAKAPTVALSGLRPPIGRNARRRAFCRARESLRASASLDEDRTLRPPALEAGIGVSPEQRRRRRLQASALPLRTGAPQHWRTLVRS